MEHKKFATIGLGGTFDRLHTGHKLFLDIAAYYGDSVHVGITSSEYLQHTSKHLRHIIQPFGERQASVQHHLTTRNVHVRITELLEPEMDRRLAEKSDLEALVVSQETCHGAIVINQRRKKDQKIPLTIIVCPTIIRQDGTVESSTKRRQEEENLDREH